MPPRGPWMVTERDAAAIENSSASPKGRLRYTLELHEDMKSQELVHIVEAVANSRLSLLFDFGNTINAYELPMPALAIQAPHVTEVHVKDCLVEATGGVVTDWEGRPLADEPRYDTVLMAANATMHRAALELLRCA